MLVVASLVLVDGKRVGAELASVNLRWLAAMLVLYPIQLALLGLRWSVIARELGLELAFGRATSEYAVSVLVNQVLPSGMAGDALRAVRHAQALPDRSLRAAVEALAIDRVSGQLGLFLIVAATAPVGLAAQLVEPRSFLIAVGAACLVGLGGGFVLSRLAIGRRALRALRAFVLRALRVLIRPASALRHLPISLAFVATAVIGYYISARALSVELPIPLLIWLGPLVLLAASIPASVGGWGLREGASALLFGAVGLPGSTGLAISVVYGFFNLSAAIAGFLVWVASTLFWRTRARSETRRTHPR
jgi:uncharacterized membrane protein YbhN (UPF0104 family)